MKAPRGRPARDNAHQAEYEGTRLAPGAEHSLTKQQRLEHTLTKQQRCPPRRPEDVPMLSIPGLPLKLPRPLSAPLARLWPQARALACMPCCPWPVRCAVGRWNDECRNLWKRHQLKANSKLNVKAYRERRGIFFRVTLGNPSSRPHESALGGRRSAHFRIRQGNSV